MTRTAASAMQSVREKDSGTLQYDWFFNNDETECVVKIDSRFQSI